MTSFKNHTNDNSYFDAVLVGAGIMSSTLALLISEVLPDIKFLIIEKLNAPGNEVLALLIIQVQDMRLIAN